MGFQNNDEKSNYIDWTPEQMVEVVFELDDDFLKIKETLTRIGVASNRDKTLYQSTHILHKRGRYYIVHFKELFALDGKNTNIDIVDIERRNAIIKLLIEWNLLEIVNEDQLQPLGHIGQFKVISFKEKRNWNLVPKYTIGTR
jgi:hypothetical protein